MLAPDEWLAIARQVRSRYQRTYQATHVDWDDLEGHLLEQFARQPPTCKRQAWQIAEADAKDWRRAHLRTRAGHEVQHERLLGGLPAMLERITSSSCTGVRHTMLDWYDDLSPRQRSVVRLALAGYSQAEIAREHEVTESAISQLATEARGKLFGT